MKPLYGFLIFASVILSACENKQSEQTTKSEAQNNNNASIALINGKIATVDENFSVVQAVAINNTRIIYVGDNEGIQKHIGKGTQIIDLNGKLVVPGLIDAHVHMQKIGLFFQQLDLVDTESYQQIIDKVAKRAKNAKPGEWILGRGWDQNDWQEKALPTHDALSKVSPQNPVALTRIDGHAFLVNKQALDIAGIDKQTKSPEGGAILRTSNGDATGVLVDNAKGLVSSKIPEISRQQSRQLLIDAANASLKLGLTSVHDAGVTTDIIGDYRYLVEHDKLPIRSYVMMWDEGAEDIQTFFRKNKELNFQNKNRLIVRSIKMMIDGALGSRGAALLEDYSDKPGEKGLLVTSYERLVEVMKVAIKSGIQVNTHAIGDRGNRLVLNALEETLKGMKTVDHRFRDEHTQIVSLVDVPRFKKLGLLPSMEPLAATSDMYWAEDRVGKERIKGGYIWQTLIKHGNIIPLSSDFPVDSLNPMHGFYAAITRQDAKGWPEKGWMPEERLTREQALRGFTIWAAYAAFQEDLVGSIEPGKLADLVVLDRDILTVPESEVRDAKVLYTIIDGKVQYQADL